MDNKRNIFEKNDPHILYVYPSDYIKDAVKTNYNKYYDDECLILDKNIEDNSAIDYETHEFAEQVKTKFKERCNMITYRKLSRMTPENVKSMRQYDLIIFDEAHGMGAEKTRRSIRKLMTYQKYAKFIGATATPLRCNDGIDVASMFFNNNIAFRYDLKDAFEDGTFQIPAYVYNVYPAYMDTLKSINDLTDQYIEKAMAAHEVMYKDGTRSELHEILKASMIFGISCLSMIS